MYDYIFELQRKISRNDWSGGGGLAYERGGVASQKFWIKPLKETDLGMVQASFDP